MLPTSAEKCPSKAGATLTKMSAYNVLFVFVVYLACYLPACISVILLLTDSTRISFKAASKASIFSVLLNSFLNPLVYCQRYQEIREIVKKHNEEDVLRELRGIGHNAKNQEAPKSGGVGLW